MTRLIVRTLLSTALVGSMVIASDFSYYYDKESIVF